MPFFSYTAKNAEGKIVRGQIEADSRKDALDSIREQGLWTTDLQQLAAETEYVGIGQWFSENFIQPIHSGVSPSAKLQFFTQMATMLRAGISISEVMRQLAANTHNSRLRHIARDAVAGVDRGEPLSTIFARHGRAFSRDQLELIRAGELSGTMDEALASLTTYLESEVQLRRETAMASCYPIAVLGCGSVLIAIAFSATLIVSVFKHESATTIPQLMWLIFGNLLKGIGAIAAVVIIFRLALTNGTFRFAYDTVKINIPFTGGLVRRYSMARFGRVFGALYKAGVPATETLACAAASMPNYALSVRVGEAVKSVKEGESLSEALGRTRAMPDMVLSMIRTGETTGDVDQTLAKVVEYYEADIKTATRLMVIVMGVLVLILMGAGVGFVVVKFYLNYFAEVFKQGLGE